MRKLVRITSANRYKIFVTSDKGWAVLYTIESSQKNGNFFVDFMGSVVCMISKTALLPPAIL